MYDLSHRVIVCLMFTVLEEFNVICGVGLSITSEYVLFIG